MIDILIIPAYMVEGPQKLPGTPEASDICPSFQYVIYCAIIRTLAACILPSKPRSSIHNLQYSHQPASKFAYNIDATSDTRARTLWSA